MDRNTAKAHLLTAISHDMRQPLQALLLYLGALDRRVKDGEARGMLAKAGLAAEQLVGMLDEFAVLARLETGRIAPQLAPTSVQAVFESVQEQGVSASPTQLHVRSDPALLETILRQLVSNGLKHGGGRVRLSADGRDGTVVIAVTDSGAGIAAEDQQRIFGEFVRLEGARADGLGLGLTIAQRLAALLGHQIEVRSSPGQGATFTVRAESA